jgi:hypothetical protein
MQVDIYGTYKIFRSWWWFVYISKHLPS